MLRVGSIGCRNHAFQVNRLINDSEKASVVKIFHPGRAATAEELMGAVQVKALAKLHDCDAIAILSPNATHFEYLKALIEMGFRGYLFCEKPPVVNLSEWEQLSKFNPQRIFFNFNLRFGSFARLFQSALQSEALGRVVHAEATLTHGLAFKPGFADSWRAKTETHGRGVFETVAIHFVDLFEWLLGPVLKIQETCGNFAGRGAAPDTCTLNLQHESGCTASVFVSYATAYSFSVKVLGTNGSIEFENGKIKVFSPRDTLNQQGFFVKPPLCHEVNSGDLFTESLPESVNYFLNACEQQIAFPENLFRASLNSNRWLV